MYFDFGYFRDKIRTYNGEGETTTLTLRAHAARESFSNVVAGKVNVAAIWPVKVYYSDLHTHT